MERQSRARVQGSLSSNANETTAKASTDEALAQIARLDSEAFVTLFRRHVAWVHSYAVWKVGREEAEDIVSDVFLRALDGIHRFKPSRSFKAWLFGIARNRVREHFRKRTQTLPEERLYNQGNPSAEEVVLEAERITYVRRLVGRLPRLHREVIELRYWAGLDFREISQLLGKKEGTLRVMVHRILARLRASLGEE